MFPDAMRYIEERKEEIASSREAKTYFGRVRRFPTSRPLTDRELGEGFNTIVQGTAADIIKIAMLKTDRYLTTTEQGRIILTLHDEILFEILNNDTALSTAPKELNNIMKTLDIGTRFPKLDTVMNLGKNWKEVS